MQIDSVIRPSLRPFLVVGVFAFVFHSVPAVAQMGLPGTNPADSRLQGHDWGIDNEDLQGFDMAKIKRSYRRGLKHLKAGECRKATQKFSYVLSAVPEEASVHFLAGAAERCQGDFEAAADHYEKAIEFDESMYLAYKNLGISHLAQGDLESALEPLAQLEVMRFDCATSCSEELESAYTDLKKVIEMAKAR